MLLRGPIIILLCFVFLCTHSAYGANYTMANGTQTVNCAQTHNVYDPGGSGGNYAASLNITQTFTPNDGTQCLALTITSFVTEDGYDFLYIYDGANTSGTLLGQLAGTPALPLTFSSTSGSITLRFTSDISFQYAGFAATLSCVACAPPVPTISMSNGTVPVTCGTTYNFYDPGGVGNYANNLNVIQTLTASDPAQCVSVTFNTFNTEEDYDFLYIFDGTTAGGMLLGTLTGTGFTLPQTFTSSAGSLTLQFVSDFSSPASGWTGTVSCTSACTYIDPNVYLIGNSTVSTCAGTFYDTGGAAGTYQNNQDLTYTICSAQSGQCVQLLFTGFDLESGWDFLSIYDGPNTSAALVGTYTGQGLPPLVTSSTGCLTLRFTSDGSGLGAGWSANISCVACGGGPCAETCSGGPAPSNDACSGALNLGALPVPGPCPAGTATPLVTQTTNLCATAEFPYSSLLGCQPVGNQASPAADVWYRFSITGPVLQVLVNGLNTPNVALYEGNGCINLIPRGCAIGGGGMLNTSFQGLAAGNYFLQVSGSDLVDQCDFTLTLMNSYDCAGCVIQSELTASPEPINGEYPADTEVTFCYTITSYNQTSANWLHGIVPVFGPGWDPATLTTVAPPSCSGDGYWAWYNSNVTSAATGVTHGPGFYFETAAGGGTGNDGNPGNNFGDNNPGTGNPPVNPCSWTFCWSIRTDPSAGCVQGAALNISINTLGDGESGSWTSLACTTDPVNTFFAQSNCCPPPIVNITHPLCPGESNGSIQAQGQGTGPWNYVWSDSDGNSIQTDSGLSGSSILSGVPAGMYQVVITDASLCTSSENIVLTDPAALVVTITPGAPNVCSGASVTLTASGASSYTWSPSDGLSATSGASVDASPSATTTYTVTGTSGSCTDTETVTVNVSNSGSATILYNGSPFCTDIASSQLPVISGTTGGVFSSSPSGLSINSSTGAVLPFSSTPGTYTVSYTLPPVGSCPSVVATTGITITALPAVPGLTPTNPCANTSTNFTASGGGNYEFFVNGISQGPASANPGFSTSGLSAGTEVCVHSLPVPPFVMNGLIQEPQWGTPLATSAGGPASSGFGANNRVDALYMKNMGGKLFGAVAGNENDGNDQVNNNWILMFIDSKPGGFNNLSSWTDRTNAPSNTNGLFNLALHQNVIFDAGFNPDYILTMNQAGATAYFDLYDMTTNMNVYLGSNAANPAELGFAGNTATGDYSRGFEFTIPLSLLGSPATQISVFVMMVNDPDGGVQTFLSNQFLTRAHNAQGNFGDGAVDFNNEPPNPVVFMLSADCYSEQCVTVEPPVTPVFSAVPPLCFGDPAPVLPSVSSNGISGSWNPVPVSNTSSATYTFTPTPPQCAATQTVNVSVSPEIITSPLYHD